MSNPNPTRSQTFRSHQFTATDPHGKDLGNPISVRLPKPYLELLKTLPDPSVFARQAICNALDYFVDVYNSIPGDEEHDLDIE